ncbi:hypothetical protein RV134_210199 [Roseovarius sp. EC-HK134]|nr:hypothetical protein RV134_210199 [Roseovarius sp. EC-HK134]VVT01831.1 hypothetical protein RV420_260064 [Roseovarius sp. EC-SD190]
MQPDKTEHTHGQVCKNNETEFVAATRSGNNPRKEKETHVVQQEGNRKTVRHDLPQEPAQRRTTTQQKSAEAGGQYHVSQKHRDQAEEAENECISRETQGRHVDGEMFPHEPQSDTLVE